MKDMVSDRSSILLTSTIWKAQPIRSLSVRMDELFSLEKLGVKGFPILSYLLNSMEKNAVLKNINISMKTFEV